MSNAFYVGLSGQLSLYHRLETIASNVANMTTTGFRATDVKFSSITAQLARDSVSFSSTGQSMINRQAGALTSTGNSLDIAIKGEGWFAIQTNDGVAYTRDGRIKLAANGQLTALGGQPILDAGGAPIRIDPNGSPPKIARDGFISQGDQRFGAIGLFRIPPDAKLDPIGLVAFRTDKPADPILTFGSTQVAQGFLERSNAQPVKQITKLIEVQRTFDLVSGGLDILNTKQIEAIRSIGSNR